MFGDKKDPNRVITVDFNEIDQKYKSLKKTK